MPELPDLQVFSKNLDKKLSGKKLLEISVVNNKKLKISPAKLKEALEGQVLKKVFREGKELYFEFTRGDILSLHLMLHGKLNFFDRKHTGKYTIIELHFSGGCGLALTDFQGIATPTLNPECKKAPDALDLGAGYLKEKMSKSRSAIKNLIMDQHVIRGIGNAYADEILWKARISPKSIASKIPEKVIRDLEKAIDSVLKYAAKQIKKQDPDIISGELRSFLKIHNPDKSLSPAGAEILVEKSGRKTYYTEEQILYK